MSIDCNIDRFGFLFHLDSNYSEGVQEANYGRGKGTSPGHYDFIDCRGTEDSILQCHSRLTSSCNHGGLDIKCGEGIALLLMTINGEFRGARGRAPF
jgi:hypothetical protein